MDKLIYLQSHIYPEINTELECRMNRWRFRERKVVFTNGCFDILHTGHIHCLAKAASMGDRLVVGVNSDASVKRLKGENRPVHTETDRMLVLASLRFVDAVVLFAEDTPMNLITFVRPDILVKGGDYQPDQVVGADYVKEYGGRVEIVGFIPGYSTTGTLDKMSSLKRS